MKGTRKSRDDPIVQDRTRIRNPSKRSGASAPDLCQGLADDRIGKLRARRTAHASRAVLRRHVKDRPAPAQHPRVETLETDGCYAARPVPGLRPPGTRRQGLGRCRRLSGPALPGGRRSSAPRRGTDSRPPRERIVATRRRTRARQMPATKEVEREFEADR